MSLYPDIANLSEPGLARLCTENHCALKQRIAWSNTAATIMFKDDWDFSGGSQLK